MAAAGLSVAVTDFAGHHAFFDDEDTVLHLLRDNLAANLQAVHQVSGS